MIIYLQRSASIQPRTSLGKSDVCRARQRCTCEVEGRIGGGSAAARSGQEAEDIPAVR